MTEQGQATRHEEARYQLRLRGHEEDTWFAYGVTPIAESAPLASVRDYDIRGYRRLSSADFRKVCVDNRGPAHAVALL